MCPQLLEKSNYLKPSFSTTLHEELQFWFIAHSQKKTFVYYACLHLQEALISWHVMHKFSTFPPKSHQPFDTSGHFRAFQRIIIHDFAFKVSIIGTTPEKVLFCASMWKMRGTFLGNGAKLLSDRCFFSIVITESWYHLSRHLNVLFKTILLTSLSRWAKTIIPIWNSVFVAWKAVVP